MFVDDECRGNFRGINAVIGLLYKTPTLVLREVKQKIQGELTQMNNEDVINIKKWTPDGGKTVILYDISMVENNLERLKKKINCIFCNGTGTKHFSDPYGEIDEICPLCYKDS